MSKKNHINDDTLNNIDITKGVSSMYGFFQMPVFFEYKFQAYFLRILTSKFAYKFHMKIRHNENLTLFVMLLIDHTDPNSIYVQNILSRELY